MKIKHTSWHGLRGLDFLVKYVWTAELGVSCGAGGVGDVVEWTS